MLAEGFLSGINNMSNPVAGVLVAALFSASPMTPPPMQPSGIQLSGAEFVVAGEASRRLADQDVDGTVQSRQHRADVPDFAGEHAHLGEMAP